MRVIARCLTRWSLPPAEIVAKSSEPPKGERIAKRLSRAGLCSRREAERWIVDGRVSVDGVKIETPATLVTANSRIMVDGKPVTAPDRPKLWRYYKQSGVVCTNSDPEGRPTVFDNLPDHLPRVMLVGRLDLNSEGLLLLTNDGELARQLELPETGWVRRYRVRVFGTPDEEVFKSWENGVTVDGIRYGPIIATIDRKQGRNAWLSVSLSEGKNREIRRVMEHAGLKVNRLIRESFGPFQLGSLERGDVREIPRKTIAEHTGSDVSAHADRKQNKSSEAKKRPRRKSPGKKTHARRRR